MKIALIAHVGKQSEIVLYFFGDSTDRHGHAPEVPLHTHSESAGLAIRSIGKE